MAILNVAFLNPRMRAKSGGGDLQAKTLKNEFNNLKNELWRDGYLSAGDHDQLIDEARKNSLVGGLTPSQRLDWDKIISDQEREKELSTIEHNGDIERITDEIKLDRNKAVKIMGNNPVNYIFSRINSMASSIDELNREIENRTAAGMDTSKYELEKETLDKRYSEQMKMLNTLDDPDSDIVYSMYINPSPDGEIIDIDYGIGKREGYYEINAVGDGKFRVQTKVYKSEGFLKAKIDGVEYSEVDMLEADPNNPGQFKPIRLTGNVEEKRGGMRTAPGGDISILSSNLRIQQQPAVNYWARGMNGSLYQRTGDDQYIKHINANERDLKIEGEIMDSYDSLEQHFMKYSTETIDHMELREPMNPEEEMQFTPENAVETQSRGLQGMLPLQRRSSAGKPVARARTTRTPQQPKEQASPGIMETAKRTFQGGVDYFKSKFS